MRHSRFEEGNRQWAVGNGKNQATGHWRLVRRRNPHEPPRTPTNPCGGLRTEDRTMPGKPRQSARPIMNPRRGSGGLSHRLETEVKLSGGRVSLGSGPSTRWVDTEYPPGRDRGQPWWGALSARKGSSWAVPRIAPDPQSEIRNPKWPAASSQWPVPSRFSSPIAHCLPLRSSR